ncbi:hypothetical protein I600_3677 [Maribacter dokdonensis DSW-8]|nr:hypothetical protein I600_3677 [Maribacter dokdonensis DSW-8]
MVTSATLSTGVGCWLLVVGCWLLVKIEKIPFYFLFSLFYILNSTKF